MKRMQKTIKDIIAQLEKVTYNGDLSDVGNEIGIAIAKYLKKGGFELDDFIMGLRHGVSSIDGTHDSIVINTPEGKRKIKKTKEIISPGFIMAYL